MYVCFRNENKFYTHLPFSPINSLPKLSVGKTFLPRNTPCKYTANRNNNKHVRKLQIKHPIMRPSASFTTCFLSLFPSVLTHSLSPSPLRHSCQWIFFSLLSLSPSVRIYIYATARASHAVNSHLSPEKAYIFPAARQRCIICARVRRLPASRSSPILHNWWGAAAALPKRFTSRDLFSGIPSLERKRESRMLIDSDAPRVCTHTWAYITRAISSSRRWCSTAKKFLFLVSFARVA